MAPRNKPSEKKSSSAENDHLPPEHGGHLRQMLDDVIHGALRPPSQHTTEEPSPETSPETSVAATHKNTELLTPKQAAALFHVDPSTVSRWARAGKISATTTLGGHRRYYRAEILDLLDRLHLPGDATP